MGNPYRHPISTPVPELQGIASIASRSSEPATADVGRLLEELRPLVDAAAGPNGWDWMFPIRVKPVDGKPTIVSDKGGNLFRGYIGTWQEADLLVALANAAPRILAALSRAAPSSGHAMAEGEREINCAVCGESVKHTSAGYCFSCIKGFKVPLTTTPPTTNDAIPAGMVRWDGGRKPEDWSGEAVQFRSGEVVHAPPAGTIWKLGWDHCYGSGDIIAYTPKASAAPSAPATEAGDKVWRIARFMGEQGEREAVIDWLRKVADSKPHGTDWRTYYEIADAIEVEKHIAAPTDQVKDGKGAGE